MSEKNLNVPGVLLILMKENQLLMLQRINTDYSNGDYMVVAGHVEKGENFTDAIMREAREEAGITITREQLKVVHIQHRTEDDEDREKVLAYLLATQRTGEIENKEPDKCNDLSRVDIDDLPENTSDFVRAAIENIRKGIFYSEYGRQHVNPSAL